MPTRDTSDLYPNCFHKLMFLLLWRLSFVPVNNQESTDTRTVTSIAQQSVGQPWVGY